MPTIYSAKDVGPVRLSLLLLSLELPAWLVASPKFVPHFAWKTSRRQHCVQASQRSVSSSPALRSKQNATLNGARARPTAINPRVLQHVQTLNHGQGLTIRGLAGPYVVIASNFAPGTTAADIQSAIENVGGPMDSCRVVTSHPTVMAELVFADKSSAETVIANFNNQKVSTAPSSRHVIPCFNALDSRPMDASFTCT